MFLGTHPAGLLQIIFRKDLATFGSQFFYYVKLWKLKSCFAIVMNKIFAVVQILFYQKYFGQIIFYDGTIFATTIFQTRLQKYFCTIYLSTKSVKVYYIVFHLKLYQIFSTKNDYSKLKTQKTPCMNKITLLNLYSWFKYRCRQFKACISKQQVRIMRVCLEMPTQVVFNFGVRTILADVKWKRENQHMNVYANYNQKDKYLISQIALLMINARCEF